MDSNFGEWYRTVHLEPDDNLLKRRWKGVSNFSSKALTKSKVLGLSRIFYRRKPNDTAFEKEFRTAFLEVDKAFQMQGNDLELAVLAGATLANILKGKDYGLGNIAALATVCPYIQGKGATTTVPDIQKRARAHLVQRSASLRVASRLQWKHIPVPQLDDLLEAISNACKENAITNLEEPLVALLKKLGVATQSVVKGLNQVHRNQLLHREESDALWWMQGRYSRDLEIPLDQVVLPIAGMIAGKELADLVRVVPGPFSARAILHQVLAREGSDAESEFTLSTAINGADREWRERWARSFSNSETIDLCPILFAVKKSLETDDSKSWFAAFKKAMALPASTKIKPIETAMQTYEEGLFIKAYENSSGET